MAAFFKEPNYAVDDLPILAECEQILNDPISSPLNLSPVKKSHPRYVPSTLRNHLIRKVGNNAQYVVEIMGLAMESQ
jgi:hypothetical protein